MSTISSIYAQSISSLYETSNIYKSSNSSSSSGSNNTVTASKQDNLTLSEEGLSMLQSLLDSQSTEGEEEASEEFNQPQPYDLVSELRELADSDKLTEEAQTKLQEIIEEIEAKLEETESESETNSMDSKKPLMPPPPMPPFPPMNSMTGEAAFYNSSEETSQDATEETNYVYPTNFDHIVSSGLITQMQADTLKAAYDAVNA